MFSFISVNNTMLWIGGGVLLLLLLPKGAKASGAVYDRLEELRGTYDDEAIDAMIDLYAELQTRGLTEDQILFLMSQALHETGLFTSNNQNWHAVNDYHNFAGISYGGKLSPFSSISDFVDNWLSSKVLDKGSYPLEASSISNFNSRLKSNGYYTDNINTYGNALAHYYNILNQ